MFWKNKKLNSWARKVDKIVTWVIIGSAIASIIWISQTDKWKKMSKDISDKISPISKKSSKKTIAIFWKIIAFIVWIFSKK